MKSSFNILSSVFQAINISSVTDVITGKVYIGDVPDGDQLENISIKTLNNPNKYVQEGYINVNIHLLGTKSGRPNLKRFEEILNVVFPLVENNSNNDVYFQIDDDKGIFKDQDADSMYFYNLKLIFQTL